MKSEASVLNKTMKRGKFTHKLDAAIIRKNRIPSVDWVFMRYKTWLLVKEHDDGQTKILKEQQQNEEIG